MLSLAAVAITAPVGVCFAQTLDPPAQEATEDIAVSRRLDRVEVELQKLLDDATRLLEESKVSTQPAPPLPEVPAMSVHTQARKFFESPRAYEPPPDADPTRQGTLRGWTSDLTPEDTARALPAAALPLMDVKPPDSPGQITTSPPVGVEPLSGVVEKQTSNMAQPAVPQVAPTPLRTEPVAHPQPSTHAARSASEQRKPRLDSAANVDGERRRSLSNDASVQADSGMRLLIERAEARRALGDILGARAFLERASRNGNAAALRMLAQTYDARSLAEWRARGVVPDDARAQQLYDLARRGTESPEP